MKYVFILIFFVFNTVTMAQKEHYNKLTKAEEKVIIYKGTERPFSGEFVDHKKSGTYVCKQCNAELYHSTDKFDSHCGWPSFDDEIEGAVKRIPDADGMRTEIVCTHCGGHLGHVFLGEGFTEKNTRHCVNSISLKFIPAESDTLERAYFAGGCFWGVEHYFSRIEGVTDTRVGYMGGQLVDPSYEDVCSGLSGHAEVMEVSYTPNMVRFEDLARLFFEIHDPTQINRQGPDIGEQYRSEIFYLSDKQKEISEKLIKELMNKGYKVVTRVTKASTFWPAEKYHQDYYQKTGGNPYCHKYTKRF